uniref:Uncharacterized protein n=1 Tax=viral metagenome TaxID=1070528 RepID=A0A6C0HWU4_9ZZZZ
METVSKKIIETYKNIYLGPFLNKKEKFQDISSSSSSAPVTSSSSSAPVTSSSSTTPSTIPSSTTTTSSLSEDKYYTYDPFFTLIAYIMFFFAIYLSFRCNNGFSFWGFLGAFLFSPFYIIYKLSSDYKNCHFK